MAELKDQDADLLIAPDPVEPEIEVQIEDDKAPEGTQAAPAPEAPAVEEEKPIDPEVLQLRSQLQAERNARAEADARAAQAQGRTQDSEVQTLQAYINTAKQGIDVLKTAMAEAMQAGDYTAAAEAQANMAIQASRLTQLETGLENAKSRPKPQATQQPIIDPVEQFARSIEDSNSPNSAAWIRAHPQYVTDPRLNDAMIEAHNVALARGVVVDTPAYIDFIESRLGVRQAQAAPSPQVNGASEPRRQQAPPAAPVERDTGAAGGTRQRTIRLTAEQREMAANMDMTDQQYAKYLVDIEEDRKAGRIQ